MIEAFLPMDQQFIPNDLRMNVTSNEVRSIGDREQNNSYTSPPIQSSK